MPPPPGFPRVVIGLSLVLMASFPFAAMSRAVATYGRDSWQYWTFEILLLPMMLAWFLFFIHFVMNFFHDQAPVERWIRSKLKRRSDED